VFCCSFWWVHWFHEAGPSGWNSKENGPQLASPKSIGAMRLSPGYSRQMDAPSRDEALRMHVSTVLGRRRDESIVRSAAITFTPSSMLLMEHMRFKNIGY
jgi:hypothetical protein